MTPPAPGSRASWSRSARCCRWPCPPECLQGLILNSLGPACDSPAVDISTWGGSAAARLASISRWHREASGLSSWRAQAALLPQLSFRPFHTSASLELAPSDSSCSRAHAALCPSMASFLQSCWPEQPLVGPGECAAQHAWVQIELITQSTGSVNQNSCRVLVRQHAANSIFPRQQSSLILQPHSTRPLALPLPLAPPSAPPPPPAPLYSWHCAL